MSNKAKKIIEIEINGVKYPYLETCGSLLDFKQETGLDSPVDLEDNIKYIYFVVRSACRRSGKTFEMSFQEFADSLDLEEFTRLMQEIAARAADGSGEEGPGKNV